MKPCLLHSVENPGPRSIQADGCLQRDGWAQAKALVGGVSAQRSGGFVDAHQPVVGAYLNVGAPGMQFPNFGGCVVVSLAP
jgi:hypothetical protein